MKGKFFRWYYSLVFENLFNKFQDRLLSYFFSYFVELLMLKNLFTVKNIPNYELFFSMKWT